MYRCEKSKLAFAKILIFKLHAHLLLHVFEMLQQTKRNNSSINL